MTNKDPIIRHELNQPSNSKLEINVMVGPYNLSTGRVLTEKDPIKMENTVSFFDYLDEQVVKEVEKNPKFGWRSLSEWNSWATAHVTPYVNQSLEEQAENINNFLENEVETLRSRGVKSDQAVEQTE